MSNTANLVHEADAQRHHVRVRLPAKLEIGGKAYDTRDWSTAGASLIVPDKADATVFTEGKHHSARLIFSFMGFTLIVPMKIEIRHTATDEDGQYLGIRFIDMTQEQIVIMQQLVGSYVTGELSSVGELIHVMSRNNFTKPRQVPKREEDLTAGERFSQALKKLSIPLITLLLLGYVGMSIFEHKFIVSAEKAVVTGDGVSLAAPAGGVVSFKDLHNGDTVKKGDALMTVKTDSGTMTSIDSPCDCAIEDRMVDSGTTVAKGSIVLKLLPTDAPLRVDAQVSYTNAVKLAKGQNVVIQHNGSGKHFDGVISAVTIGANSGDRARVMIHPLETLPKNLIGAPVSIKFNTLSKAE